MRDPATRIDPKVETAIDFAYTVLCDMGMLGWTHWTDEDKNDEFKAERGRHANRHRDLAIAIAVRFVRERGFNPTRNRANHKKQGNKSACAIVTAAIARAGVVLLDESAVEKIWEKQRKRLPHLFQIK